MLNAMSLGVPSSARPCADPLCTVCSVCTYIRHTSWQRKLVLVMPLTAQTRGRPRNKLVNVQHHPRTKLDTHGNVLCTNLQQTGTVASPLQAHVFSEARNELIQAVIVSQRLPHYLSCNEGACLDVHKKRSVCMSGVVDKEYTSRGAPISTLANRRRLLLGVDSTSTSTLLRCCSMTLQRTRSRPRVLCSSLGSECRGNLATGEHTPAVTLRLIPLNC